MIKATYITLITIAACSIGLGVGLGVGLTRDNSHPKSSGSSLSTSSFTTSSIATVSTAKSSAISSSNNKSPWWKPPIGLAWDYHLQYPVTTISSNIEVYDIDLFENSRSIIDKLHKSNKKVICYFSAGSYEDWRNDSKLFKKSDLGEPLDGWKGERWLKLNSTNVRTIMSQRIKLAYEKECDSVDPDNIDGYDNDNGLGLTKQDSIDYIEFLSQEAHKYNLSISLKNGDAIIKQVITLVDFSVQEQCVEYENCEVYSDFIKNNKTVFHVEYPKGDVNNNRAVNQTTLNDVCNYAGTFGFSTIIKNLNLDDWIQTC